VLFGCSTCLPYLPPPPPLCLLLPSSSSSSFFFFFFFCGEATGFIGIAVEKVRLG
jgi:hypothetical protein